MNHFQSLKTLAYGQVRRILRIWIQTIIPPAITTALYFLIFGELIGRRIGEMPGYEGLTYLEFMVPGLIMLAVILIHMLMLLRHFSEQNSKKQLKRF